MTLFFYQSNSGISLSQSIYVDKAIVKQNRRFCLCLAMEQDQIFNEIMSNLTYKSFEIRILYTITE